VVDHDRVYLFGPEGMLHCVAVQDGHLLWRKNTAEEFAVEPNFFGVGSSPLVEGDLLIAQIGGRPPRGQESGLVAMDKKTGQVRYAITGELASYSSPVAATIQGRRWGFAFARGGLVGFEPATGKVDFHYPWRARIRESVNICTPVVAGDLVFVSEAYGVGSSVLRVRPGGYEVVWADRRDRPPSMASYFDTPVHVDGFLYGSSGQGRSEAELRCVELSTGKIRWSRPDLGRCSLLFVDGFFVCLGEDGVLRLLKTSPDGYQEVAQAILRSPSGEPLLEPPAWAAPVLSHGLLYVRGKNRLVCLELIPAR
jgi:outer membrane protein assembly factor BamB